LDALVSFGTDEGALLSQSHQTEGKIVAILCRRRKEGIRGFGVVEKEKERGGKSFLAVRGGNGRKRMTTK